MVNKSNPDSMLTDFGNEQRMVDAVCGQIKFDSVKKVWYIWNTKIGKWEEDITGKVHEVVKFVFRNIREVEVANMVSRAEKITDEIKRNELKEIAGAYTNFALKCQNPAKIKACLDLCQTNKNFAILSSEFDKNSNLLNFNNGTLNLTTGGFYTHKKDDMITKTVGYDYDSGAKCPKFEAFISSLFDSNKEKDKLVRYLKMAFGLCLTGDTHHQVIQMCVGSGSNGKSALLGSIQQVFGEYGSYLNGDSLTENRKGQIREDIANLEGKRFVYASENTKGSKLDNELVKQLSGGSKDVIQVRRLYGHYFNFYPQCKIFWAFNHSPYISDMTLGLWRRIKIIPFDEDFEHNSKKRDPDVILNENFKERAGIMNWLIDGFNELKLVNSFDWCDAVKTRTSEFKDDSDSLSPFMDDVIEKWDGKSDFVQCKVRAGDLFDAYCGWAYEHGYNRPLSLTAFGKEITERIGRKNKIKDMYGVFYHGIKLKNGINYTNPRKSLGISSK